MSPENADVGETAQETPVENIQVLACVACGKPFKRDPSKRGRPATKCDDCRAKNAPSVHKNVTAKLPLNTLPPEIVQFVAVFPLIIGAEIAKRATTPPITIQYTPESLAACSVAFQAWLASLDVELTPGWALLSCYVAAIVGAIPGALMQRASDAKRADNEPGNPVKSGSNPENTASAV